MMAHLHANVLEVTQLLIMPKDGFISAYKLFMIPYLLLVVLFLFFSEHCTQDRITGALIHS